jgi:hypothetical protein
MYIYGQPNFPLEAGIFATVCDIVGAHNIRDNTYSAFLIILHHQLYRRIGAIFPIIQCYYWGEIYVGVGKHV